MFTAKEYAMKQHSRRNRQATARRRAKLTRQDKIERQTRGQEDRDSDRFFRAFEEMCLRVSQADFGGF